MAITFSSPSHNKISLTLPPHKHFWHLRILLSLLPFSPLLLFSILFLTLSCRVTQLGSSLATYHKLNSKPSFAHLRPINILTKLKNHLWTVARQALLSIWFCRKEYWSVLPCPPPGDLPNPGIEPTSLVSPALAGEFFNTNTLGSPFLWSHCPFLYN